MNETQQQNINDHERRLKRKEREESSKNKPKNKKRKVEHIDFTISNTSKTQTFIASSSLTPESVLNEPMVEASKVKNEAAPDIDLTNDDTSKTSFYIAPSESVLQDETMTETSKTMSEKGKSLSLHDAAEKGDALLVKELLAKGDIDINTINHRESTALHVAAFFGHHQVANTLLDNENIDVNITNKEGFTALQLAVANGNIDVVKALLEKKEIKVNATNMEGFTALQLAANNGNINIVKALLAKEGIDVNTTNKEGFTALQLAQSAGHLDVVKALLGAQLRSAAHHGDITTINRLLADKDIDVNDPDHEGYTALHIAAKNGNLKFVNKLLKKKDIDVDVYEHEGFTALHLAEHNQRHEVVKALLGAKLRSATHRNDIKTVNKLLTNEGVDVNNPDNRGNTALHLAAYYGHPTIVKKLLGNENIDINTTNKAQCTALHMAILGMKKTQKTNGTKEAREKYLSVITELLNQNIWINVPDKQRRTALHYLVELFIEDGYQPEKVVEDPRVTILSMCASYAPESTLKEMLNMNYNNKHKKTTMRKELKAAHINNKIPDELFRIIQKKLHLDQEMEPVSGAQSIRGENKSKAQSVDFLESLRKKEECDITKTKGKRKISLCEHSFLISNRERKKKKPNFTNYIKSQKNGQPNEYELKLEPYDNDSSPKGPTVTTHPGSNGPSMDGS